jgi:hypothetical protein
MVAIGMTIAAGAMTAKAQYDAGKFQNKLNKQEAKYEDEKAKDAVSRGVEQQDKIRAQIRRVLGAQRAGFGGSGIDISAGGSPFDVAMDSEREGELDMLTARNNAAREAFGYRSRAQQLRKAGKYAKKSGKSNALGTILTTGASAYGMYKV